MGAFASKPPERHGRPGAGARPGAPARSHAATPCPAPGLPRRARRRLVVASPICTEAQAHEPKSTLRRIPRASAEQGPAPRPSFLTANAVCTVPNRPLTWRAHRSGCSNTRLPTCKPTPFWQMRPRASEPDERERQPDSARPGQPGLSGQSAQIAKKPERHAATDTLRKIRQLSRGRLPAQLGQQQATQHHAGLAECDQALGAAQPGQDARIGNAAHGCDRLVRRSSVAGWAAPAGAGMADRRGKAGSWSSSLVIIRP